jgi:serine/threonine-protein kinase RsbT
MDIEPNNHQTPLTADFPAWRHAAVGHDEITMEVERRIPIQREEDIITARHEGRELSRVAGFAGSDPTMIAAAISEVVTNIFAYAGQGEIILSLVRKLGRQGIMIVARDDGPGIADIELALRDGFSTGNSLGLGLPGVRRLMDEFEIVSQPGHGTVVTMRKWA